MIIFIQNGFWNKQTQTDAFGPNLVPNGNMELNSNWNNYNSGVQSSEQAHGGTYSWKIVASDAAGTYTDPPFVVESGSEYQISFWIYVPTAQDNAQLIYYSDATGNHDLGGLNDWGITATGSWQYVEINNYAVDATTIYLEFLAATTNGNDPSTFYLDDVQMRKVL